MGKYTQKISGFWLYSIVMKFRYQSQLSIRNFMPIADEQYSMLSEVHKEMWKTRAKLLRETEIGQTFRLAGKALKSGEMGCRELAEKRENDMRALVSQCWDMLL
jgi:hypothetical protein